MVEGPWSMVHGRWSARSLAVAVTNVDGPWTLDHGPSTMDHRPWTLDHGPSTFVTATAIDLAGTN